MNCAFEVKGEWSSKAGVGSKHQELVPLAYKESDRVGEMILADARELGKTGHVVVWRCGSVMCVINCQKSTTRPGKGKRITTSMSKQRLYRGNTSDSTDGGWVTGRLAHLVTDEALAARAGQGMKVADVEPGSDCSRGAHHFLLRPHAKVKTCKNCGENVSLRRRRNQAAVA